MNRILAPLALAVSFFLPCLAGAQEVPANTSPASPSASAAMAPLPKIDFVVKGKDFHVLPQPQRASPGRTELLVFFWYGSPWAAKIDPYLRSWVASGRAPANLRIQYVPMTMGPEWMFGARVFYALEELGLEQEITPRLLRAVQSKVVDMSSPVSVQKWMTEQGVSPEAFQKAINSNYVVAKTASLPTIASTYHVRSSPTFILDGAYHVSASSRMSPERAVAVAMFFAQKLSEGGPRP